MTSHQQASIFQFFVRLPIERIDQPGEEASFAFPCGAVTTLTAPQPGVEQVPEGVTEHVEGVDGNRQAKPRPQGQVRCHLHVLATFPAEQGQPPT